MKLLTQDFYDLVPLYFMSNETNETKKSKVLGTFFLYKYFFEHQTKAIG